MQRLMVIFNIFSLNYLYLKLIIKFTNKVQMCDCEIKNNIITLKLSDTNNSIYYCKAWNVLHLSPAVCSENPSDAHSILTKFIGENFKVKLQKSVKRNNSGDETTYLNIISLKQE